ncbi:unnamed protein product [Protopolystoma xenopodis]|uniref:Uncharacterized protein n=1 Tax=Protopolystoma xenopodis TaxID=117903 RepID=A0A448WTZ8_9PLAT|nr:unnamed protein product [Protopolystoma xenopodis]
MWLNRIRRSTRDLPKDGPSQNAPPSTPGLPISLLPSDRRAIFEQENLLYELKFVKRARAHKNFCVAKRRLAWFRSQQDELTHLEATLKRLTADTSREEARLLEIR